MPWCECHTSEWCECSYVEEVLIQKVSGVGFGETGPKKEKDAMSKHTHSDGTVTFDVSVLWELSKELPIEQVQISSLMWHLELECWTDENERPVRPIDITGEFHEKRIREADLAFPIILAPDGHVMDGLHRLLKAIREDREVVSARRFTAFPSAAVQRWWESAP